MSDTADSDRGELPPPTGPPAGGSGGSGGAAPASSIWSEWNLPFDSPREAAEWWYGSLLEARTWVGLAYLLVGAVLSVVWFTIAVVLLSVSLPLIIVLVGVPLTVLALAAIDAIAGFERRRAGWVGDPIPPRPFRSTASSWWGAMAGRLTDATRWRQVAFVLASVVVFPVLFAVAALPVYVAVNSLAGFDLQGGLGIPSAFGIFQLGGVVVAAVVAGFIGRVAPAVAGVAHSYVAWFLGPDRTAELEARVDTLSDQRTEILDAVSAERRRIERNLHDGVQQQLVAIGIDIGRARARVGDDPDSARQLLDEARQKVHGSVGELRLIGRGLHPAVLDDRGLDAALSSIVASAPIPIEVSVDVAGRIPSDVAETAYYVANEAVANVLKHARARVASIRVVEVSAPVPAISLTVHDDGRGGADPSGGGSGLSGMAARVRGADGTFSIASPPGGPTLVSAIIPLGGRRSDG